MKRIRSYELPVSGEEEVYHVIVEVLVAGEVLVDQGPDPRRPLWEPHHPVYNMFNRVRQ